MIFASFSSSLFSTKIPDITYVSFSTNILNNAIVRGGGGGGGGRKRIIITK